MCAYSFVADWGYEKLTPWVPASPTTIPWTQPPTIIPFTPGTPKPISPITPVPIEFIPSDEWRKQFLKDLMDLLAKAKKYDDDNGEPNCELESKKEKLKAIADELGVEVVFP